MGDIIEIDDQVDEGIDAEFNSFISGPSKVTGTSLDWWFSNQHRYPTVAKLSRKYLAIPATSVPSERAYSTAGLTLSKQRSSLEPEIADAIIFLNKNLNANSGPHFPPRRELVTPSVSQPASFVKLPSLQLQDEDN